MALHPSKLQLSPPVCLQLICLLLLLTDSSSMVSKKDPVMPDPLSQLKAAPGDNVGVIENVAVQDSSETISKIMLPPQKNMNHPSSASSSNQQPGSPDHQFSPSEMLPKPTTAEPVINVLVTTTTPRSTTKTTLVRPEATVKPVASATAVPTPSPPSTTTTTTTANNPATSSTTPTTTTTTPATTTTTPAITTTTPATTTTTPATTTPTPTTTTTTPATTTPTPTTTTPTTTTPTPTTTTLTTTITTTTPPTTTTATTSTRTSTTTTTQTTQRPDAIINTSPHVQKPPVSPAAMPTVQASSPTVPPTRTATCYHNCSTTTPTSHNELVASKTKDAVVDVMGVALTRRLADTGSLMAILFFGLLFLLVTVAVFVAQAYESYRRKDYTQVDYLINGMYSDSGV